MARISSFIICDTINNFVTPQGETVPQLVAPQPALRPQFIPGSFSFALSIGVSGVKFQKSNIFSVTISSPKGDEVFNSGDINIGDVPEDNLLPEEYQGLVLSIDIRNMAIECEGAYPIEITMNGTSIGKKEIPIFRKGEEK